jgi:hypothetical protein
VISNLNDEQQVDSDGDAHGCRAAGADDDSDGCRAADGSVRRRLCIILECPTLLLNPGLLNPGLRNPGLRNPGLLNPGQPNPCPCHPRVSNSTQVLQGHFKLAAAYFAAACCLLRRMFGSVCETCLVRDARESRTPSGCVIQKLHCSGRFVLTKDGSRKTDSDSHSES